MGVFPCLTGQPGATGGAVAASSGTEGAQQLSALRPVSSRGGTDGGVPGLMSSRGGIDVGVLGRGTTGLLVARGPNETIGRRSGSKIGRA